MAPEGEEDNASMSTLGWIRLEVTEPSKSELVDGGKANVLPRGKQAKERSERGKK